jgi:hypothetical protein
MNNSPAAVVATTTTASFRRISSDHCDDGSQRHETHQLLGHLKYSLGDFDVNVHVSLGLSKCEATIASPRAGRWLHAHNVPG